eukprot:TRINITY_DN34371_c0_g2_i1.p1 TRINITY_DN34371_c0_g2~~TRINITY_DN34371_c0_g2_i1.p1  ORF type:complete len:511 (-),score=105.22 TRINITY_DN34371_c0_g2_i1:74-1606(-)
MQELEQQEQAGRPQCEQIRVGTASARIGVDDESTPSPLAKRFRAAAESGAANAPPTQMVVERSAADVATTDDRGAEKNSGQPIANHQEGVEAKIPDSCSEASNPLESVDVVVQAWADLQPQLAKLQDTSSNHHGQWEKQFQSVMAAARVSDSELAIEQETLARQRYGSLASSFCVLPPSISSLLPMSTMNDFEIGFAEELQEFATRMGSVRERLLLHITAAKARGDRETLRALGPRLGEWSKEIKNVRDLNGKVGRRLTVGSRRITEYRAKQKVREIDPSLLVDIDANFVGYTKVLDFYRHSDAQRFSFGRQMEGPQHFADIRRNVAILDVWDDGNVSEASNATTEAAASPRRIFNGHAVSGVDGPGVNPDAKARALFEAKEARDGLGETYLRDHDAEFKLCAAFCACAGISVGSNGQSDARDGPQQLSKAGSSMRAMLFSKKPLCASCHDVVFVQLLRLLPGLQLQVIVDEPETSAVNSPKSCCRAGASPAPTSVAGDNGNDRQAGTPA